LISAPAKAGVPALLLFALQVQLQLAQACASAWEGVVNQLNQS
jgi:hypothetical protein